MKNLLLFVIITLGAINVIVAQQTPQPTPDPQQAIKMVRRNNENAANGESLRNGGYRVNRNLMRRVSRQSIEPLYRKPTKSELKVIAPNKSDAEKFVEFLRQPNTGITKLAVDFGCGENTAVVNASAECLKYSMPGGGSSFSFRVNNYRIRRLADLTFTNNKFHATGIGIHGILVNLGDISLDQISLNTSGLTFINDFQPTNDFQKALEIERDLLNGVEKQGFVYSNVVEAKENTTYILRSIAYRGTSYRTVQGFLYDEFGFDKRKDIIIAFRIISRDADGGVTILWKQLQEKKSPEIKRTTKTQTDIEENKFVAEKKYNQ